MNQKELNAHIENHLLARAMILAEHGAGKPEKDISGEMPCPVCEAAHREGTLKYSISARNGHIWGRCSTEGCVAWME